MRDTAGPGPAVPGQWLCPGTCPCQRTSDFEGDKINPNSQPPGPLPSRLQDQELSGQWLGALGSSVLPLSDTEEEEEEGAFVTMDQECMCAVDEELSPCVDPCCRELCLWDEVTVRDFHRWQEEMACQEVSPCGAVGHQELPHWHVGVSMPRADERQQEWYRWGECMTVPGLHQWDKDERCQELSPWEEVTGQGLAPWPESVTVQVQQELYQWDDDENDRYQKLSLWQDEVTGQEEVTGPWEEQGYRELSTLDEDVQRQWEEVKRDIEFGQVQDLFQGKDACVQGLPQWETHMGEELCEPLAAKGKKALHSLALDQEVAWAEPQSPVPGLWSPSGGSSSLESVNKAVLKVQGSGQQPKEQKQLEPMLQGQPAPHNEQPSLFRRCCCCCLRAQPQD